MCKLATSDDFQSIEGVSIPEQVPKEGPVEVEAPIKGEGTDTEQKEDMS